MNTEKGTEGKQAYPLFEAVLPNQFSHRTSSCWFPDRALVVCCYLLYVYVFVRVYTCQGVHVEGKGQLAGVDSLLLPCGSWELNSCHQASAFTP